MSNENYKIIVAGYNCYNMIENCVNSIIKQTYKKYDVCMVDDASTDERQAPLVKELCKKYGWKYLLRKENAGALRSQHEGILLMNPQDGDVIVWVDMDDAFSSQNSLKTLDKYYEYDTAMTYGSYKSVPYAASCPIPSRYPEECEKNNDYRNLSKWGIRYNHLRTVRWDIYKHLEVKRDFMVNGKWMNLASDAAVMIPCLEMSGGSYKFIPEVLYSYTSNNPISEWRKSPDGTEEMHLAQRNAPKHEKVDFAKKELPIVKNEKHIVEKNIVEDTYLDKKYNEWITSGKPRDVNGSVDHDIKMFYILRTIRKYNITSFVESGTSHGDGINAILPYVKTVNSVEAWKDAYGYSSKRFQNESKVTIHFGDSAKIFPSIIQTIEPSVFWLDAHYSGDGTAKLNKQTPIMEELEAIAFGENSKHCIIIDDARGFGKWKDYPTIDWMQEYCKKTFPNHDFFIEGDEIFILPS